MRKPISGPFRSARQNAKERFNRATDQTRLVFLGALLVTFGLAALALALMNWLFSHIGGASAIFGGVAVAAITSKLAKRKFYADWMVNGICYAAAGIVLSLDESLQRLSSLLLICALLLSSALARVWIGLTTRRRIAAIWMLGSGGAALFTILWTILASVLQVATAAQIAISLDTFVEGLCIAAFGASLRPTVSDREDD